MSLEQLRPGPLEGIFSREALEQAGERLVRCRRDLVILAKVTAVLSLGGAVGLLLWILFF